MAIWFATKISPPNYPLQATGFTGIGYVSQRVLDQENISITDSYGIAWILMELENHLVWWHHFILKSEYSH